MNAERLLALYERVAEAPDAITRLRRFILDLAVRGKLVPQDPNDEPASELLKRIAKEKARLVKAGEMRIPKTVPLLFEAPYSIPPNWQWSQLSEIGILNPRNTAADLLETSFVPMPMIAADYGLAHQHEVRPWGEIKKGYTHFAEGDVGLAKITPCFENGKSAVFRNLTGGIGAGTTELHIVRPLSGDQDYILLFLKSPHFIQTGIPKMTGTAGQKRVPTEYFAYSPFPLPPLAEQHRIVAKVDELMALCDRLEAARKDREVKRDRLSAASLTRLNTPDPETFTADARFTLEALPALTIRPNQIRQLRQTILNLAVRGKLVPQDPNDEPASELLKRMAQEKARLVKAGEIRKPKLLAPLERTDTPLVEETPGWHWVRLGSVATLITKGSTPTSYGHAYTHQGVNFIKVESIRNSQIRREDIKSFISPETNEFLSRSKLEEGDILFSIAGSIGTCAVVSATVLPANTNQALAIIRGTHVVFSNRFLLNALRSSVSNSIQILARGGAMNNVSLEDIHNFVVPVPPLAEQHRIVAKVDELMTLCDRLEASLTTSDQTRTRLLEATLAEALSQTANDRPENR
jgi:type I restriction enzyme S subunit